MRSVLERRFLYKIKNKLGLDERSLQGAFPGNILPGRWMYKVVT